MSLPKDLRDQLLTGYMDDALSADERARVDQLLQSDAEMADELQQLLGMRQTLKAIAKADAVFQLEEGFADRVLDAAVARARAEGMSDDHPLIRLAEQPSSTRLSSTPTAAWRVASVLIGLAASIAIVVFALRPEPRGNEVGPAVAQLPEEDVPLPDEVMVPDVVAPQPAAEMVAEASDRPTTSVPPTEPEAAVVDPAEQSDPDNVPPAPLEAIAQDRSMESSEANSPAAIPEIPSSEELKTQLELLGAILVLDVQRTETGRQTGVVRQAMELASIAPARKQDVTEQIASYVSQTTEKVRAEDGDDVQVLYLQVPAKNFDLFYRTLWTDAEGVKTIRLKLALEAPLVKVVNALRVDPTTIQHDNAAIELFSDSGVVDEFADQLGQLDFPPGGDRSRDPQASMKVTGPDIQARVLLLIR